MVVVVVVVLAVAGGCDEDLKRQKTSCDEVEEREKDCEEEKAFKLEIENNGIMLFHWLASSRSGPGRTNGQTRQIEYVCSGRHAEDPMARSAALARHGDQKEEI